MIVLLLAWALGAVIADVGTAQFLAGSLQARRRYAGDTPEIRRRCAGDALEMRRRCAGDTPEMRWRYARGSAEVAIQMIDRVMRAGWAACMVSTRADLAHMLRGLICNRSVR